ncbi:Ferredoxin [Paenibacillus polysaccharolyticus]|uniref:Ferredoxin n=2 Tax=Paenibacillus TaxID=44249 RepID=A0A1G5D7X1_9BACL|nr:MULTISPECIES: ferredoxin [Paenibacillus]MBY0205049.1 ferredoxin [Paenibacillus cucumis (ex Kampfer et al. 2016)]SCY10726.1 Ferredoxin [Paenibacillus polysaccharolyticus]
MQQLMKRIAVSDKCVACGSCVVNSEFLTETPEGFAIPVDPGLITEVQYLDFKEVEVSCPVQAISVEDEYITGHSGSEALVKLKALISEKLDNFSIPYPSQSDYDFVENNYEAPPLLTKDMSAKVYNSYDKADREGFNAFKDTMYSQQKALIQAVCINYKTKQLKKFSYYNKTEGNYFYDINREIAKTLGEVVVLGQAISNNQLNLPADFSEFDVGPDFGFEGESYCYRLRHLERYDWNTGMKEAEFFKTYINVEDYGDGYKYSLVEAEKTFREYIVFGLSMQMYKELDPKIETLYKKYSEVFQETLNKKLSLLKSELKKHINLESSPNVNQDAIIQQIKSLVNETKSIPLKKESVFRSIDTDYDSSFRFSSHSKASEAAQNRVWRLYKECSNYLEIGNADRISFDLANKYQTQLESTVNTFKKKLQAIYDKHGMAYPNFTLELDCGAYIILVDLSDYNQVTSHINGGIREFIDENVIGWGRGIDKENYFSYSDLSYDVIESITWKQGLFGEKEVPVFCYHYFSGEFLSGFYRAIEACCDYVFESGYMRTLVFKVYESLQQEVKQKIIPTLKK